MKALITGITGFAGSHLAELLLSEGAEVYGTARWRSKMENVEHLLDSIHLAECDLRDAGSVSKVIADVKPDHVYHLAAQSFVPSSWKAPAATLTTNIVGQLNLFEALRAHSPEARVQIAGSSEEYGLVLENELPITEENPLRPLSPYAVSKIGQDMMGYQYNRSYGMHVIRTRAFNHTGPRRGEVFATSSFAKQIAAIEAGKQEPVLRVGNLEAKRDFTDVRDVVRGYRLAVEKCEPGEVYNICSGVARPIGDMLNVLLGLSSAKIKVEQDPDRLRPSDVPVLQGDSTKFSKRTGWKPVIPFERTMSDLLDYWRERIA
jgi:GDP-4-dehydro-6-deoxy-D-mannose reductase